MEKKKDNLTINGSIVFILTTIGSAINYLCQILMGRFFSVENYGIINTIFSLTLIITVVGNTAFMLISKLVSKKESNSLKIYKYVLKLVNISSIVICIMSAIICPVLLKMLGNNILTYILTIICIVTSIYPILYQGVFGGTNHFAKLGLYTLIIPIIKAIGVGCVALMNINGDFELQLAVIAIIIGNIISIIVGMLFANKNLKWESSHRTNIYVIKNEYLDILVINSLLMFLMNVDVLSLNYFFDVKVVGLYSSVLIFGKIVYYFVTALVTVMLPIISKNNDDKYATSVLYKTLLYTFALTVIVLIPLNLFTNNILGLVFGDKYIDAYQYMKYTSVICLSYSLNVILFNYLVGIDKTRFIRTTFIIGVVLSTTLLALIHSNEFICLSIIASINILIFIVNSINIKINISGGNDK